MNSNAIMVKEYLSSLKEDEELDYLFPVLLNLMGFKIIATPKQSKGQPQFGKDIVAVFTGADGIKRRYYFELKGSADKDIDDTVMTKKDGIIESFRAAKLVSFSDASIPGFNELPIQYVLVHNGTLNSNTRPLMDGFVKTEFPEGNFERWDISDLTDKFSKYLFSEYLLTDDESVRLFKRTLVLLDAPDNDFADFIHLIDMQIDKVTNLKGSRSLTKFFATANLLTVIIIHYSKENDNLYPARQITTILLLKVWCWILEKGIEKRKPIAKEFNKLLKLHSDLLGAYFNKLMPVLNTKDGLFSEYGRGFEAIGAPLRAFDLLGWLIYYYSEKEYHEFKKSGKAGLDMVRKANKEPIKSVVRKNLSCRTPILDNQGIVISLVFLYFLQEEEVSEDDLKFLGEYLIDLLENIRITRYQSRRFPEFRNNINALVEFVSTRQRPPEFTDSSSLLINLLFELLAVLNAETIYQENRPEFAGKINLQVADCVEDQSKFELLLFTRNLNDVYYSDVDLPLPERFADYKEQLISDKRSVRKYRTDSAGYPFLKILAHLFFQNEILPNVWRSLIT